MSKISFSITPNTDDDRTEAVRDLLNTIAEFLIGNSLPDDEPLQYDPSDTIKAACCRFINEVRSNGMPDGYDVSEEAYDLVEMLAESEAPVEPAITAAMRWAHDHPEEPQKPHRYRITFE